MKKSLFALSLLIAVVSGSSFTDEPETINRNILSTFHKNYGNAGEVKWETNEKFAKATFTVDGKTMFVYYKDNGEEIATTRNLTTSELPANLKTLLRKKYSNQFWLTQLFEVSSESENNYYASLTNGTQVIVYKSTNDNNWQEFSRRKIKD